MSTNAQKSKGRLVNLRDRAVNGIEDEDGLSGNALYVPDVGPAYLETLMQRMNEVGLCPLGHTLVDDGVIFRFRRQRDVDQFKRLLNGG